MRREDVETYLRELKRLHGAKDRPLRIYTPYTYFRGLTTYRQIRDRFEDILTRRATPSSDRSAYRPFTTDRHVVTRPSRYTILFRERWGGDSGEDLVSKSQRTGVPLDILETVFDKGRAAWRTGHRPGATQEQWGFARVHSFLVLGCTALSADFHLLKDACRRMRPAARRRWLSQPLSCPAYKRARWTDAVDWLIRASDRP